MNMENLKTLTVVFVAVFLTGQFVMGAEGMLSTPTMTIQDNDKRIESAATNSYVFKTYLKKDVIEVQANDGVVVLKGSVSEDTHKQLAENTVSNLPGVKSVQNELAVKGEQPLENSDAWIRLKVKSTLLFHRLVNAFKTEVDVKDGIVTLSGYANDQAQKDLTTEYTKDVKGVKEVINQMTVSTTDENSNMTLGAEIDDASITAQVKEVLMAHQSTSAIDISIATNNGQVTVTGVTKSEAEKELVSKLIKDINGVKGVLNKMTVQGASS